MDLKKEIDEILFKLGQEIKIHKIDNDNMILEIDYEKYSIEIINKFKIWLSE